MKNPANPMYKTAWLRKAGIIPALAVCQSAIINPQSKMLFAQSYQWAKNIGGTSGDEGYSIAVDKLKITIFAT